MLRLLADENFNGRILRALQRRTPNLDVVRLQDTSLQGSDDPSLLAKAAEEGRVVLTHDLATLIGFAIERIESGLSMPGVVAIRADLPIGSVIADLELLIRAVKPEEIDQQIWFLPL